MKPCSTCKEEKSLQDFNRKSSSRDGLQSHCRMCSKVRYKIRYDTLPAEKARLEKRNAANRAAIRVLIREAKNVPCSDCGNSYPYYVMDFDHIADDKDFNVASGVWYNGSLAKIKLEIEKCEVVCSNCHRERTHNRLQ